MPEDDDILEAYEAEFDGSPFEPMPRHANRGFWMVAGTMALGAVILLVEIFANRPMVNAISRTENDLKAALRTAERIYADGGTFTAADAEALGGCRRRADVRRCGPIRHLAGDRQRLRVGRHVGRGVADRAGHVLLREAGRR